METIEERERGRERGASGRKISHRVSGRKLASWRAVVSRRLFTFRRGHRIDQLSLSLFLSSSRIERSESEKFFSPRAFIRRLGAPFIPLSVIGSVSGWSGREGREGSGSGPGGANSWPSDRNREPAKLDLRFPPFSNPTSARYPLPSRVIGSSDFCIMAGNPCLDFEKGDYE